MKNQQHDKPKTNSRPKMKMNFYKKAFESFEDLVKELRTLHSEFIVIFNNDDDGEVYPEWMVTDVLNYFSSNIPVIGERKNLPMTISIAANKVSLKTNKFFTIEWSFKYDKEGNTSDLVATIITFTKNKNPEDLEEMISKLEESWEKQQKPVGNK